MNNAIALDVVLPVYNEEKSLETVLWELYREIYPKVPMRFIISEDGSTDRSKVILRALRHKLPITLLTHPTRRGYSYAMKHGLQKARAPYVLCIDSDGQYDPKDFWKLWNARQKYDIVVGYRKPRVDSWMRLLMSRVSYLCFRPFFPKNIHDPSCSFVLFRQEVAQVLHPVLGLTNQGFWWEFMVRAAQFKLRMSERVVRHRARFAGNTKIYSFVYLPKIVLRHVVAMVRVILVRSQDA